MARMDTARDQTNSGDVIMQWLPALITAGAILIAWGVATTRVDKNEEAIKSHLIVAGEQVRKVTALEINAAANEQRFVYIAKQLDAIGDDVKVIKKERMK